MFSTDAVDVYLDVDGVLNAVCKEPRPAWGWPDCERVHVDGFLITYSPTMVRSINALAERAHVTMFWLTTWLHDAVELASIIGLKAAQWPVLEPADYYVGPRSREWWKIEAIREHSLPRGNRVLWVDDDIPYEPDALAWLHSLPKGRAEAICPDPTEGLTVKHMCYIEAWIG